MLDQLGFADALAGADLVVTGEGSLDEQTLRGKAPAAVAAAGRAAGVPVIAVAGRCLLDGPRMQAAGFSWPADPLTPAPRQSWPCSCSGPRFTHPSISAYAGSAFR